MAFFTKTSIKIGAHIALGLALGAILILVFLSSSTIFKEFVQERIERQIEHDYHCKCRLNVDSIDIFGCRLECSNLRILPTGNGDEWSISAEKMYCNGSWVSLLLGSKFKVAISFKRMIMLETYEKIPFQLAQFCSGMFDQVLDGPISYDLISLNESIICLTRKEDNFQIHIPLVCHLRSEQLCTRVQCYVHDGFVGFADRSWLHSVEGSILCDVPFVDVGAISGQIQLNYMVNRAGKDIPGFAVGSIKQGEGEFSVKTQDHSFILDPIKMKCSQKSCWCETMVVATAELLRYFQMPELFEGLAGTVGLSVKCDLFKILQTLQASVIFNDVMYQSKSIISGAKLMIVDHSKNGFRGIFAIQDQELFNVAVQFGKNKTTCAIENVQDLSLFSGYTILKNKCHIDVLIDQSPNVTNGTVKIEYDIVVQNDVGDQFYIKGEGLIVDGILKIVGRCNDLCFESSVRLQPRLALEFFVVKRDDALLIDVNTDPSDAAYAVGAIDFSVLRAFLQQPFQMSFAQQGSFVFKAYCKEGAFGATVQTHYAHIRVPYVYNVIQNVAATCEFNWIQKELMFKDIDIQLYEGKIYCSQAKVHFDKNFNIEFVHVPLMVHDVLLSWNKSIYGLVSGNLLAQKMSLQDMVLVQGQLMVQKAEIKENIFSTEFQDLLSSTSTDTWENAIPLCADVSLFTKQALQINTSFLTAQAVLGVNVKGPIQKTELSGTIKLLSGQLHFPYKPLEIVEGKLLFTAEQLLDPAIEFLAKGKVKRYHVSLKAWGTASDPHMQFESEPYLGEDQIMSLLLLGVEDQSLSLMIPAFLYQRLKDIMFGSALSDTKLKSIFDTMLQSLKYVRFIPQFTNQTGRGGVRGLFEIDATEHLQGTIDTNFTHLEDTKFDVDYAVADDVTLRLQKDGPSTYGGQVEFRWKFS